MTNHLAKISFKYQKDLQRNHLVGNVDLNVKTNLGGECERLSVVGF